VRTTEVDQETGREGSSPPNLPVITLLTDFGTADYFVGAVKGAILSVNPNVVIVDITHEIPAQDIEAGAFMLLPAYKTFPRGTIHVAVVDPGVGSSRRPIIVTANEQFFVGPDNGLFTYIYDREPAHKIFHVTADKYFRPNPSSTFHGRDIFGPIAGALSAGPPPEQFGPLIYDEVRLSQSLEPLIAEELVHARIIHIDRFGNCVTNIRREAFDGKIKSLSVNGRTIETLRNFYGEADSSDELFAIWGSAGLLEISVNGGSAASILQVNRGQTAVLILD